jgi:transketolase
VRSGIANLYIYDPADAAEALDCLVLALRRPDGPCLLLLSAAPTIKLPPSTPHLCARGAYLVHAPPQRDVTLLAAGNGLALALRVHDELATLGVHAALVSMPCRALFDQQDTAYRHVVLQGRVIAITTGTGGAFAGLTGPGDLVLTSQDQDGGAVLLAAMILRHLHRGPAKVEI